MVTAAKKAIGPARDLRVSIDPKTGDINAFAKLIVVEVVSSKHDEISLSEAKKTKRDAELGEEIEIEVTPANFGRIASQNAKQALMQQLRRAEKQLIYTEFKDRTGDIVSGVVRRFDRSDVMLDLGKFEAILPNRERVPTEEYQIGERIRCFVKAVELGVHGPDIILSRSDPNFVIKLFQVEVSEINDGTIEIKAIAREAGYRTKLAVYSHDSKVDPVGACVGLRGQRVKNIVRELNNEKVDIIPWSDDQRTFVGNALSPANLLAFTPDVDGRHMLVVTKCLSVAQTCSFILPKLLVFLMDTKADLCEDEDSMLPEVPTKVWRQMRADNFLGWPGLREETVNFYEKQHPLLNNAWPLRTYNRPVFDGEFEDAIIQTHSPKHRGNQAHAPFPTSQFDLLPHGRDLNALEVMPPPRQDGKEDNGA